MVFLTLSMTDQLVLYSLKDSKWKVADFGLTMEGTSVRTHTTADGRGTACYRAPELIKEYKKYNNKVDIFGLGCILYELATGGTKAFADDYSVREYMASGSERKATKFGIDDYWNQELNRLINSMLAIKPGDRPPAEDLSSRFAQNYAISMGHQFRAIGLQRKAIEEYEKALEIREGNPAVYIFLGESYQALELYPKAIEMYRQAMAISNYTLKDSVHGALGECLYRTGDDQLEAEAIKILERSLEYASHKLLIEIYGNKGDTKNALKWHKMALKRFPDHHPRDLVLPKSVTSDGPEISSPYNFRHLLHVGLNLHTGQFVVRSPETTLLMIGITS
jgi:tetratricopeptide (TPR) repeat protein